MTKYFDYSAATPLCKEAMHAMEPYYADLFYNPSALYMPARRVKQDLEEARSKIAVAMGARPGEIIFTAGGTEANNLAIHGVMTNYPDKKILISAIEHEAVIEPTSSFKHSSILVNDKALVDINNLEEQIDDDTVMVSVMYANNEVGTIQPISEIAQLIKRVNRERQKKRVKLPLYFHTDACQASSHLDIHVSRVGADLITINGGKIYGPKQSGALYVRAGIKLAPLILGGGQENGLRSGTENVAGAVGLSVALDVARSKALSEKKRLEAIRDNCIKQLSEKIPETIILGHLKKRLPHNVCFAIPGIDNERLMMLLDERGFQVATGSACQASSEKPSHVLTAMGLSDEVARSTLRLSFGRETTDDSVNNLINAIKVAVSDIKNL